MWCCGCRRPPRTLHSPTEMQGTWDTRFCQVRWSGRWSGRATSPPTPPRTTSSVRRGTGIVARPGSSRSLRAAAPPSGRNQPLRSSAGREKTRLHSFSRCILGPLCHSNLVFVKWKKAGFKTVHRTLVFLAKNGHAQTEPQEGRRVREDRRRSGLVMIVRWWELRMFSLSLIHVI